VEPRTGSWVRYQEHNEKGVFCLLFSASKKAGRRIGETFVWITNNSSPRMRNDSIKKASEIFSLAFLFFK